MHRGLVDNPNVLCIGRNRRSEVPAHAEIFTIPCACGITDGGVVSQMRACWIRNEHFAGCLSMVHSLHRSAAIGALSIDHRAFAPMDRRKFKKPRDLQTVGRDRSNSWLHQVAKLPHINRTRLGTL
jgi:hypothetical protein